MGPGTGAGGAGQQGSERAVEQRRGGLGGEEGADEGARVTEGQRLSGIRGTGRTGRRQAGLSWQTQNERAVLRERREWESGRRGAMRGSGPCTRNGPLRWT